MMLTHYINRAIAELDRPENGPARHMILRNALIEGAFLSVRYDAGKELDTPNAVDAAQSIEGAHRLYAPEPTADEREAIARDFGFDPPKEN